MTVNTTPVEINYTGNASTTVFALPFAFAANAHVKVYLGGVLQNSGYSITGAGNPSGGTLTMTTAPGSGVALKARRVTPLTQDIDVVNNATVFASSLETGLDYALMRQQEEAFDRAAATSLIRTDAARNLSAGAGAGLSITTAQEAALFGVGAGEDLTTGVRNAAFGESALSSLTTGGNNVALGRASLINLTTGDENVGGGSAAGASLTTGVRNTFVGTDAGFNGSQKVDAISSIGIGRAAYTTADFQAVFGSSEITETVFFGKLRIGHGGPELARFSGADINYFFGDAGPASMPTGTRNLAIGASAGDTLTTGGENVLVGVISGEDLTTGIRNAALGESSLSSLTTGSNNTAAGRAALINLTTGGENVGSGSAAGASLTGGAARNTFVGTDAGFNGSQKVDAISSIGLGRASYTTKDYQAVLGSSEITETVLFGALLVGHGGPELARLDGPNENYFIGDAGPATLPTGGGNAAFGKDAGNALTTGAASVFIGKDAGKAVTTGVDHTFVGAGAGIAQVSGVGCVAIGRLAGKTSVSATNWTALGDTALESNTANGSVGVGYGCGRDHTSGTGFCGVGLYAGGYGNANRTTVMGTEALNGTSYGDDNSLFGYRAGHVTTGANNAAFGSEALRTNTTGYDNTGFGYRAGFQVTTGYQNTFLGRSAGHSASQKVDAVNSMALGYLTFTTKNNQVVIGNSSVTETLLRGQLILGAESTTSVGKADLISIKNSITNPAGGQLVLTDTTAQQAGCGGQLVFRGAYTNGGALTEAAAVQAQKTNGTDGNFGFDLTFHTRVNGGNNTEKLRVTTDGVLKQITFTVATLPAASVGAGSRAFVTDANATTFASIVAGGGANGVPVYSDGTNWRIG